MGLTESLGTSSEGLCPVESLGTTEGLCTTETLGTTERFCPTEESLGSTEEGLCSSESLGSSSLSTIVSFNEDLSSVTVELNLSVGVLESLKEYFSLSAVGFSLFDVKPSVSAQPLAFL